MEPKADPGGYPAYENVREIMARYYRQQAPYGLDTKAAMEYRCWRAQWLSLGLSYLPPWGKSMAERLPHAKDTLP